MYVNDFVELCHSVGFRDPRQVQVHPIEVEDPDLKDLVGNATFFRFFLFLFFCFIVFDVCFCSITFRLFKIANLERLCEDYGQVAVYKVGWLWNLRNADFVTKGHSCWTSSLVHFGQRTLFGFWQTAACLREHR
jgi:hypothetical protein